MSDLSKLQYISLCSKVIQELENHIGLRNKDLTEYIIEIAKKTNNEKEFLKSLEEDEADFSQQFSSSLYILIQKMLPMQIKGRNKDEKQENINPVEFKGGEKYVVDGENLTFEEREVKENTDKKILSNKFPSLIIPDEANKEEIILDLSPKQGESKIAIPEIKKYKIFQPFFFFFKS